MTSLAAQFGINLLSKQSWADMDDSDDDSAPMLATTSVLTNNNNNLTTATNSTSASTTANDETKTNQTATTSNTSSPALKPVATVPAWTKPLPSLSSSTSSSSSSTDKTLPPASSNAQSSSPISATQFSSPLVTNTTVAASTTTSAQAPKPNLAPKQPQQSSFKTWGELTASFGGKSTTTSSASTASNPLPSGLDGDEEEESPTSSAAVAFDPDLDSSRDGLPLMIKSMAKPVEPELSVVMEEEMSKSRQGTKRKEMASTNSEGEEDEHSTAESSSSAPVDMTALVAGFKAAESAPPQPAKIAWGGAGLKKPVIPSESSSSSSSSSVQEPASGKKLKQNDGTPKNVEVAKPKSSVSKSAPSLARPNSFLAAVTGVPLATIPDEPMEEESKSCTASSTTDTASAPSTAATAGKKTEVVVDLQQRLKQRQKQIAMGKDTPEYRNYIRIVPISSRGPEHPRTPDVKKDCSKRAMDGLVRKWRRLLHEYDADVIEAKKNGTYVKPAQANNNATATDETNESEGESMEHSETAQ